MSVDLLGKFQSSIIAHLLLAVVHGGNLQNHCQVTARGNGDGVHRDLDAQNFHIMVFQTQPVIGLLGIPGYDVYHQIDLVLLTDGTHAEQLCHIDDADTTKFDVVADQLRRSADKGGSRDFLDLHRVVGNQTVSALQKLHSGLTFADAAVTDQHYSFAVDLHQNAVAGNAGG